jgi:hypothetical protein
MMRPTIAKLRSEIDDLHFQLALARAHTPTIRAGIPENAEPAATPHDQIMSALAAATLEAIDDGPLVTIACVTRNAAHYLPRAIASMRAQTYRNTEILVQDGASTDETLTIVREHGLGSGLISEPDHGTTHGLVNLAQRARGEIIAVCWADDELLPHAVGWAAAMFARCQADVIYGDALVVFDDYGREQLQIGREWDLKAFSRQHFFPPFAATFFSREALLSLGRHRRTTDEDE